MVKDDGGAAMPQKTLETPSPDGKISKELPEAANLQNSQIGKDIERGTRVSEDGGDDMSVTLAELSSRRAGKRGSHQLKDAAIEESNNGDGGLTDEKLENASGGGGGDADSSILRRSGRNRIVVDPGIESKKLDLVLEEEKKIPENEDEDEDEDDDEDSEFSVGDFVWGKVKSYPWWPGRVFDSADASQQALKYKHEGRILVAYFGDFTFAWCEESQLKPFVENFAEMSKQSESKRFLNAVEEAVAEFGRLVELDMTCYCTPKTEHSGNHQVWSASNAGIKEGVGVNKGGIGIYSVDRFNPASFLSDLRLVGKHASVGSSLELTTLKSWMSAVYRSKDGSVLLKVNELQEGAEDEGIEAGNGDSSRGTVEEPVQVIAGMLDAVVPAKRKERSVAEILYGDEKANEDGGVVEGDKSVQTESISGRKKRKIENEKKLEEAPKGETKTETETDDGDKAENDKKVSRRSNRKEVKVTPKSVVVESNLAALEESEMSPRTRERKKSKYFLPPYTNPEYFRQTAVGSPRGQAGTKAVGSSNASQSGETSSKWASLQVNNETSKKKLSKDDVGEHGKHTSSAPVTPGRASSRTVKDIASSNNVLSEIRSVASGQLSKGDQSLDAVKGFMTSYRFSKYQNESIIDPSESDFQSEGKGEPMEIIDNAVESEVVNEKRKSLKKLETKHGKAKANKTKEVDSEKDGLDPEVASEGKKSLKKSNEGKKSSKNSETMKEKAKLKKKAKVVDSETDGNNKGTSQSAALHLKFPSGYTMPSKDDLGALFGKFGELDTSKTRVYLKSFSARLVFLRRSDAEAACKSSEESSPFGETEVRYRIRHPEATSDENGLLEKDPTNSDSGKRTRSTKKRSLASASGEGGIRLVKQKLEGMATMVADAGDGKMSSEMKSELESRLKDLLDEVKALPSSS